MRVVSSMGRRCEGCRGNEESSLVHYTKMPLSQAASRADLANVVYITTTSAFMTAFIATELVSGPDGSQSFTQHIGHSCSLSRSC